MSREHIIVKDIKLLRARNRLLAKDLREHFNPATAEGYDEFRSKILLLNAELKGILGERKRLKVLVENTLISVADECINLDKYSDNNYFTVLDYGGDNAYDEFLDKIFGDDSNE